MKYIVIAALLVVSNVAAAKGPQAVSIGKGVYMMTDRNFTIFGSADGIISKLMTKANLFCQDKSGGEAELVESDGSNAVPGTFNDSGVLRRPAQGATGTIHFRCGGSPPDQTARSVSPPTGRFLQVREYGNVSVQLTMPNDEACRALVDAGNGKSGGCASASSGDNLPFRSIIEDDESQDLLVVEAVGSSTCESFVSGLTSSGGLTVIKACYAK